MDEEIIRKLTENVVIEPGPWIFQFCSQLLSLFHCTFVKIQLLPTLGEGTMASHFMEGTSVLARPALLHLNASLLMVMQVAASGCLNTFACFSWHARLSTSILFSAALLISSLILHTTSQMPPAHPIGPPLCFSPSLCCITSPLGFSASPPPRKKNGWGRDLSDGRPGSSNFFLLCTTPGHLCLYKVTSCLWNPYFFSLLFLFSTEPMGHSHCTIPSMPKFHSLVR